MSGETKRLEVLRVVDGRAECRRDVIIREAPVTILLDDAEVANLMCSPKNLDFLAVGFLFAEGLIDSKKDIKKVLVDEREGVVWVETKKAKKSAHDIVTRRFITTGCGKGLTFVDPKQAGLHLMNKSRFRLCSSSIPSLMWEFHLRSRLFKSTGGAHSAAICSPSKILVFNEDIGRHSAIDKVVGECVLKGIKTNGKIMVTSGRISSEILVKAARSRIPVIVSKSAPTDLAVKLANDFGIAVVGFARGHRMNVYSNPWRVVTTKRGS